MRIIKNKYKSIKASASKPSRRYVRSAQERYKKLKSKEVKDFDGWWTEYTLYCSPDKEYYFCILGDPDIYNTPEDADWEGYSEWEAYEWFDDYEAYAEDDDVYGAVEEEPYEEWTGEHDQYEDVWDSIKNIEQEFTSENTSTNSKFLPAIFDNIHLEPGTTNLDYGGGRYDNVADYLAPLDVVNMVLDPFNRSKKHNREVINLIREIGGTDTATCANVLNVIKEPQNRMQVLNNLKALVKPGGKIYIWIYEGDKSGVGGPTTRGYQLNKRTDKYMDEILQVFPNARLKSPKSRLIIIDNNGSGAGSGNVVASYRPNDLVYL